MLEAQARVVRLESALGEAVASGHFAPLVRGLQALRGIKLVSAATLLAEVGDLTRFDNPKQRMAYAGLVPSEHSSGARIHRGRITRAGNAQARTMLVEAGWSYRLPAREERRYRERVADLPKEVQAIGWKAQVRRCQRFRRLSATGKPQPKVTTAIANWSAMPGIWHAGWRLQWPTDFACGDNERRRQRISCIALASVPRAPDCDGQSTVYGGAGSSDARA